jgi:cytochrome c oxidase subunit 2
MHIIAKKVDSVLLFLLLAVIACLPFGISIYDRQVWEEKIPAEAKNFTLTGHTDIGWVLGEVRAHNVLSFGQSRTTGEKPVIEVKKGQKVVLKLKSSDVVHGFSLKEFGIFINDGIQPGKVVLVSFSADKAGVFTFACNAICGDNHQNMQGTLVVRA